LALGYEVKDTLFPIYPLPVSVFEVPLGEVFWVDFEEAEELKGTVGLC
jgi:hypothetical protein